MRIRRFGLIGEELSYSFSVDYFAEKFEKEGIRDARYDAFPLKRIEAFPQLLEETPDLIGLNVTIPYKEAVIPYLDSLSETARSIGAVNTIRLSNGKKEGFNTDCEGFEQELRSLLDKDDKNALILGTGGASKAVRYILEKMGFRFSFVSRKEQGDRILSYEDLDQERIAEQDVIVNTTPLGTWPKTDECPPIPYEGIRAGTVLYDLVYNPAKTLFLQKGETQGAQVRNGYGMLVGQAEAAWRIWNEEDSKTP